MIVIKGIDEMGLLRIDPHENVPLWVDEEHRVIRIPGTRLKLETVIHMYYEGCTEPKEIVRSFDTLTVDGGRPPRRPVPVRRPSWRRCSSTPSRRRPADETSIPSCG